MKGFLLSLLIITCIIGYVLTQYLNSMKTMKENINKQFGQNIHTSILEDVLDENTNENLKRIKENTKESTLEKIEYINAKEKHSDQLDFIWNDIDLLMVFGKSVKDITIKTNIHGTFKKVSPNTYYLSVTDTYNESKIVVEVYQNGKHLATKIKDL